MVSIRKVNKADIPALKAVLDSIELFPAELLEEMISDFFQNQDTQDLWFTAEEDGKPISIAYCAPEKLTAGTYNLYAIGVHKEQQGKGIGQAMMSYLENELRRSRHRILIVETSDTDDFRLTRKFYEDLHYSREAVIRDFWAEGDDKVIYWKKLN